MNTIGRKSNLVDIIGVTISQRMGQNTHRGESASSGTLQQRNYN